MTTTLVWSIAAATIAAILFRPRGWPEAVWACLGAGILVISGLVPLASAGKAVARGTDVYLFLAGMMLLSELARREGVFDWLASLAVAASKGSLTRLFTLVYLVGIVVTVFLSNDATAVVLTPAVYAAVKRARSTPLPYLFICAFIANAASFVLPISNPANLVVYGQQLPPLLPWLGRFLLPAACSILVTYVALRWVLRQDLQSGLKMGGDSETRLTAAGRLAAWGIAGTGVVLLLASGFGLDLGAPTAIAAVITMLLATRARVAALAEIVRGVSWSVLPLVAGLFVLVESLSLAGAMRDIAAALAWCAQLPRLAGELAAGFGIAALSNVMNNLPSGLLAGGAMHVAPAASLPAPIGDAVLIGVDLGPNLSVTGSLATLLWLIVLRREGLHVDGWQFLKIGLIVMPAALGASLLAVWLVGR